MKWCRKAADQGNMDAKNSLGALYANGDGVDQDYPKAAKLFREAAKWGSAPAQKNLGIMYINGHGVPKNNEKAYSWLARAADQGDEDARKMRDEIAAQLTPAQLARAKKAASKPLDTAS
jgi:TPR repeat protein